MAHSKSVGVTTPKNAIFEAILSGKRSEYFKLVMADTPWRHVFDENGNSVLHLAVIKDDFITFKYFVNLGANFHKTNKDKISPLFYAALLAKKSFIPIVDLLVAKGVNLMGLDEDGNNLLMAAIIGHQSTAHLKALISRGLPYDLKNKNGHSILDLAEMSGNVEAIRFFILKGMNFLPNVDLLCETSDQVGLIPVFLRAIFERQSVENLQWLVDQGYKWDIADKNGNTALHFSLWYKNLKAAEFLVSKGVNIQKKNILGWTALQYAEKVFKVKCPAVYEKIEKFFEDMKEKVEVQESGGPSSKPREEEAGPSQKNVNVEKGEVDGLCEGLASLDLGGDQPMNRSLGIARWSAIYASWMKDDKLKANEGGEKEEIPK